MIDRELAALVNHAIAIRQARMDRLGGFGSVAAFFLERAEPERAPVIIDNRVQTRISLSHDVDLQAALNALKAIGQEKSWTIEALSEGVSCETEIPT